MRVLGRSRASWRVWVGFSAGVVAGGCGLAAAQPETFFELGPVAARVAPASASVPVPLPGGVFNLGTPFGTPGEVLTLKWFRFDLTAPIENELFFDIEASLSSPLAPPATLTLALYDAAGGLVLVDDNSEGVGFSFGSIAAGPRAGAGFGRDGRTLTPGAYWVGLAAGSGPAVSAGTTNWELSTTQAYQLGVLTPNSYFASIFFTLGNTTPVVVSVPENDNCVDALGVVESPAAGVPAWVGTTIGATNDGTYTCFVAGTDGQGPNDVWLWYTPSADGLVRVSVGNVAGEFNIPVIARFGACGGPSVQCAGLEEFVPGADTSITFPVVAGVPELIGVGVFGGGEGNLRVEIGFVEACGSADFDGDGDVGTDADIEAFFSCLAGNCCASCQTADFNVDGDTGTDADIEAFFRVLAGGGC